MTEDAQPVLYDVVAAAEAERFGLVAKVLARSPAVLRLGRDAFYVMQDMEFERAFLEKRDPVWKGR
jgi:hypothetical protein